MSSRTQGQQQLPTSRTAHVSLHYKYSKKLIKTLLILDYNDDRTFQILYNMSPEHLLLHLPHYDNYDDDNTDGQQQPRQRRRDCCCGIPNHILGFSTNFKYVHMKLIEYSQMDDSSRQKEYKKWISLQEWEQEMYTKHADEIMYQRRQISGSLQNIQNNIKSNSNYSSSSSAETPTSNTTTQLPAGQGPRQSVVVPQTTSLTTTKTKTKRVREEILYHPVEELSSALSTSSSCCKQKSPVIVRSRLQPQAQQQVQVQATPRAKKQTLSSVVPIKRNSSANSTCRRVVGSKKQRQQDVLCTTNNDDGCGPTVANVYRPQQQQHQQRRTNSILPIIPTSVWVDHILPLLDRTGWNATTSTCKEIYNASRYGTIPPWPETLLGTSCNVQSLTFSSDGKFVAFASPNGSIQVFDRRYGCETLHQAGDGTFTTATTTRTEKGSGSGGCSSASAPVCCFSPTGTTLACSYENMIVVWEINSKSNITSSSSSSSYSTSSSPKRKIRKNSNHNNTNYLKKSQRDNGTASSSSDTMLLCSPSKQSNHRILKLLPCSGKKNQRPTCLAFSPDGTILVAAVSDSYPNTSGVISTSSSSDLHFWNLKENGRHIGSVESQIGLVSLAFSSDGLTLAGGAIATSSQTRAMGGAGGGDGNDRAATGTIFVWDVSSIAFSVMSDRGISTTTTTTHESEEENMIISPEMIHPLFHEHPLTGISYSKDGRFLASSHTSGCIVLWSVEDNYEYAGEYVASQSGTTATSLAFSPFESVTQLVCGKSDGTIKVLNVDTNEGTVVHKESNPVAIEGLAFSPDGQTIVSATNDGLVRLSPFSSCPV